MQLIAVFIFRFYIPYLGHFVAGRVANFCLAVACVKIFAGNFWGSGQDKYQRLSLLLIRQWLTWGEGGYLKYYGLVFSFRVKNVLRYMFCDELQEYINLCYTKSVLRLVEQAMLNKAHTAMSLSKKAALLRHLFTLSGGAQEDVDASDPMQPFKDSTTRTRITRQALSRIHLLRLLLEDAHVDRAGTWAQWLQPTDSSKLFNMQMIEAPAQVERDLLHAHTQIAKTILPVLKLIVDEKNHKGKKKKFSTNFSPKPSQAKIRAAQQRAAVGALALSLIKENPMGQSVRSLFTTMPVQLIKEVSSTATRGSTFKFHKVTSKGVGLDHLEKFLDRDALIKVYCNTTPRAVTAMYFDAACFFARMVPIQRTDTVKFTHTVMSCGLSYFYSMKLRF
jgi:hypothetical protein